MSLVIYNSLKRDKETFTPIEPGHVKMYVCGPTVYDFVHVGNFRGAIFFNLVRNWLEKQGYKVTFVYNYTDVDDRIIDKAVKEGKTSLEISERYISEFESDFKSLKLRPHSHNPKVTDFMEPIVDMVQKLISNEHAYVTSDGEVLYAVRKFATYGKLSNKNVDDLMSGHRVDVDPKKKDPLDFALWKPAKPGEPKWQSPWCEGRPGWHIECSAMSKALLGETIDIHGGGSDLIFPHHENEIAQSEGSSGKPFVKYWMHNNMLTFGDRKMSKSLGNIKKARDFLNEYNAEILKYLMLSAHYRSLLDFSAPSIDLAIAALARIYSALALAEELERENPGQPGAVPGAFLKTLEEQDRHFTESLNDDFNTVEALASVFNVVRSFNASVRHGQKLNADALALVMAFQSWVKGHGEIMALFQEPAGAFLLKLDDLLLAKKGLERVQIDQLVQSRSGARLAKDFKRSDELRDELKSLGIAVHDKPTGSSWEVEK